MPNVIVIRLHPAEPIEAADFPAYLTNLTITAFDVSFTHPEFTPNPAEEIGEAPHVPGDPANRIVQHIRQEDVPPSPVLVDVAKAVATALIAVPPGGPEYGTKDVLLRIERGGQEIVERTVHYNVTIDSIGDLGDFDGYKDLETSILLALPSPGIGLDPNVAHVEIPEDGSPPNFSDLRAAVITVLEDDPGGAIDDSFLAELTPQQCHHVAYEIVWNRGTHPLPTSSHSLDDMYTGVKAADDPVELGRRQLEAELVRQTNTLNAEADRLGRYVYSLSAAIKCEQLSDAAERVGFRFPVRPDVDEDAAKIKEAEVTLFNP